MSGATIVVGTLKQGIFVSTNNGASWIESNNGLPIGPIISLAINGSSIAAGISGFGIFLSTNSGATWTGVSAGLKPTEYFGLAWNGAALFAGSQHVSLYRTTDNGTTWSALTRPDMDFGDCDVTSVKANGSIIAASFFYSIGISDDNGATWRLPAGFPAAGNRIALSKSALAAADIGLDTNSPLERIHVSTDNGYTMSAFGFYTSITDIAVNDDYVFVGARTGLWRKPVTETGVKVDRFAREAAKAETFAARAPLRREARVSIEFRLPRPERVVVKIFTVAGHEIASLADSRFGPGSYRLAWDAGAVAPGCYVVKMQAGSVKQAKRISIVR
jgi:hypothetical protein